ncbi:rCG63389 [Rattus norvegicus]|uniref:RCG63389 n=1 Tax=Rattus norvegicus TaxID=10116 RepID=A6JF74_RAT|nr:rCG63389 [Rattus norvegicus]
MVAHTCNPSNRTQEAEAGGSQVQGQPGLQSSKPAWAMKL